MERQPRTGSPPATPLTQVLSLLLQPESQGRSVSDALRQQANADPMAAEVLPLIPAILTPGFHHNSTQQLFRKAGDERRR